MNSILHTAPGEAAICGAIARSGLFDADWYEKQYPQAAASGLDPILHYARIGERAGYKPSPQFFNALSHNPDKPRSGNLLYDCLAAGAPRAAKNPIPVVFAANENYAKYLSVALASLIYNTSDASDYAVYIFHTNLSDSSRKALKSQATPNVSVETVDVSPFTGRLIKDAYVARYGSVEVYFRILITKILSHFSKVVYLDSDLVLNEDIANLYREDVSKSFMGVAENFLWDTTWKEKASKFFEKPVPFYFNSGVLLINNENFIRHNLFEEFMRRATSGKQYLCWDQDILNIICNGRVKKLSMSWNFSWTYFVYDGYKKCVNNAMFREYARYFTKPAIAHFAGERKAWHYNDGHFAKMFWKYARYSPFFEEIRKQCPYSTLELLQRAAEEDSLLKKATLAKERQCQEIR